jgi:hypothetical protein
MKLNKIRLIDLLPLKEVKEEEGEGEGGANPFAGSEKAGEEPKEKAPKKEESTKVKIKFNISAVKKYNDAQFTSDVGEIVAADKNGMSINVIPDQVGIHVNYQDIL